jgi:hypothetical protein
MELLGIISAVATLSLLQQLNLVNRRRRFVR